MFNFCIYITKNIDLSGNGRFFHCKFFDGTKIIIKPRGSTQQNRIHFKLMIVIFEFVKKITKYTIKVTFSLRAHYNPDETVLIKQLENNGIMTHMWI